MKITPSLAGAMSGSLGGLTASHNRGGAYLRRRVVPTNPNSIRQQDVRSNFGSLVQFWTNTLDATQRSSWTDYAASTPVTDVLGQALILTGQQMFIRSNVNRLILGFAIVGTAPLINNTGEPVTAITLFANVASPDISITAAIAGATSEAGDVLYWVSTPLNPTINFFKGPYQFMGSTPVAAAATTAPNTDLSVEAASPLTELGRYGLRARIQYDDGRLSQPFETILTLAAAP